MENWIMFTFWCEGNDTNKQPFAIQHEFIHKTEIEARRETIYVLNDLYGYYPRKLTILKQEAWQEPFMKFD